MEANGTRREIIRQFILGSAAFWCGGVWHRESVLAVQAPSAQATGTLTVKPSQFPALAAAGGSVLFNVGLSYPVAINRGDANAFYAVNTCCAHLGCTVNAYSTGTNAMNCGCHGSSYHIDGTLAGGPATRGLDAYPALFDGNDKVTVRLPGISYSAQDISIQSIVGSTTRLKLTFRPSVFTNYQVQYRAKLSDTPQVIPFSKTPSGAANLTTYRNTVFNPDDPTPLTALYVDVTGTLGFFSISLPATVF